MKSEGVRQRQLSAGGGRGDSLFEPFMSFFATDALPHGAVLLITCVHKRHQTLH